MKSIDGFLAKGDHLILNHLAKRCKGLGHVVEIGSYKGRSTVLLAEGLKGNGFQVYAVDHHKGSIEHQIKGKNVSTFQEFKKNIKRMGVDHLVTPMVMTSKEAAKKFDKPIELLFIDGDHSRRSVEQDLKLWFPKVIIGGTIALHDNNWKGPRQVIDAYIKDNPTFSGVREIGIITYGWKAKNKLVKLPIIK